MAKQQKPAMDDELPKAIAKPATRALNGAGITRLSQLVKYTEAELLELHGMGPKAMGILREVLAAQGKKFAG